MIQEPEDDRPRAWRRRERDGAPVVRPPVLPVGAPAPFAASEPDATSATAPELPWGDPFAPYAARLGQHHEALEGLEGLEVPGSPPWSAGGEDVADRDPTPERTVPGRAPSAGRSTAIVLALLRPWLDPRPGELRGLVVLLTAALTLSLALWFDATRRPSSGRDGTVAAVPGGVTPGVTPGDASGGTPGVADGVRPGDGAAATRADGSDGWGLNGAGEGARAADGPVVHVSGAVLAPGVVELPRGARVADAITAAGGAAPDAQLDRLNLARVVDDGEQVHVARAGEDAPPPESTASRGVLPDGRIDLNAASAAELETLPGVGPARAQAIIAEREVRPFRVPGDLRRVPGIGEVTFQRLAPLVVVR